MEKKLILLLTLVAVACGVKANAVSTHEVPGVDVQPASYFYTGKPYDADLAAYMFMYRTYNPELNRWTTTDPSGFPDGAQNSSYVNKPTYGIDPSGLTFLFYTGGRAGNLEVWSGQGWQYDPSNPRGRIDWGDKTQSWSALSGSDNSAPINSGWWDVQGGFSPLGWTGDPSDRPEYDYLVANKDLRYNGSGNGAQGSMSAWAPAGYEYGHTQFKQHLEFIQGRGYSDPGRSGIAIHPDGPTFGVTAGCIGIPRYEDAVQVYNFLSTFLGEVYVAE
jgi:RHS repeat-associated protein